MNKKNAAFRRLERKRMASSKEYLNYLLDQLSDLNEISFRQMMGEYIIYYKGKIIGGIYDDRFLVKKTKSSIKKISPNMVFKTDKNFVTKVAFRAFAAPATNGLKKSATKNTRL